MASLLRPLVDQDLAMVFYDMTTIRAAGLSEQEGDWRHYGMAKEDVVARQVMLGVVQTAEGLPLSHEVFEGNTAEVTLIKGVIEKIVARFPIKRVIAVADRGLSSSTLPERKWLISLKTNLKAQTTKPAWQGLRVSAVSTPGPQTATSVRVSSRSIRSGFCHRRFERSADECV